MMSCRQDRFQLQYMTAQNFAHHERLMARGLYLLRRSQWLCDRSQEARTRSKEILREIDGNFLKRSALLTIC
jgi:hypothetical protein